MMRARMLAAMLAPAVAGAQSSAQECERLNRLWEQGGMSGFPPCTVFTFGRRLDGGDALFRG